MTYAVSAALQTAVFGRLQSDAALSALIGDAVYDCPPPGTLPPVYVALGPEKVSDAGDSTGDGARHDFTVSVIADTAGFLPAKEAAGAITDALHGEDFPLSRGALVGLWFRKAVARHDADGRRRIDLVFRARTEDTVAP